MHFEYSTVVCMCATIAVLIRVLRDHMKHVMVQSRLLEGPVAILFFLILICDLKFSAPEVPEKGLCDKTHPVTFFRVAYRSWCNFYVSGKTAQAY